MNFNPCYSQSVERFIKDISYVLDMRIYFCSMSCSKIRTKTRKTIRFERDYKNSNLT